MADNPINRIPNLPVGQMTDANGNATPEELNFRQTLVTALQGNIGSEGLVCPSQSAADIATIVANTQQSPGATPNFVYTCAPGTFFYDTTTDTVHVTILVAGVPTLKQVTLV